MIDFRKVWDNIVDFRRKVTAAIRVRPSDSKHKDFHLALAEYLHKELKTEGLPVTRHDVVLKVKLNKLHKEKYEHVVIDCHAGKMYLRGKDVSDRYFGRLRRFEGGSRASDAYHCVAQSAKRIISRIQKLMEAGTEIQVLGEVERIDLRKNKVTARVDMRKTASVNRVDMRKTASVQRVDMRKPKTIIEIRDHRQVFAWVQNGKVVASAHDDRVKKVIERVDLRKVK